MEKLTKIKWDVQCGLLIELSSKSQNIAVAQSTLSKKLLEIRGRRFRKKPQNEVNIWLYSHLWTVCRSRI